MTYQFGEASRLYAQNVSIVSEMEKAFTEDLKAFFTNVSDAVARGARPSTITANRNGKSWYWWPGGVPDLEVGQVAVWCYWSEPAIITDSCVSFYVGAQKLDEQGAEKLRALAPSLRTWSRPTKKSGWSTLQLDTKWTATEDPVEVAAAPVVAALAALDSSAKVEARKGR